MQHSFSFPLILICLYDIPSLKRKSLIHCTHRTENLFNFERVIAIVDTVWPFVHILLLHPDVSWSSFVSSPMKYDFGNNSFPGRYSWWKDRGVLYCIRSNKFAHSSVQSGTIPQTEFKTFNSKSSIFVFSKHHLWFISFVFFLNY